MTLYLVDTAELVRVAFGRAVPGDVVVLIADKYVFDPPLHMPAEVVVVGLGRGTTVVDPVGSPPFTIEPLLGLEGSVTAA